MDNYYAGILTEDEIAKHTCADKRIHSDLSNISELDNEEYLKIEYKLEDKEDNLSIDFLLGFQGGSWKLWIGKIGSCSYDDDPYCSFDTAKFAEGIVAALDKVEEFVKKVKDDPEDYVQYYTNL